ncbi:putative Rossmann fold enzyme [Thermoplasmatales archaeon SCGC AB-539-N05]|nr:putative Rossmann fold enzyme [Thermoplasmatales archaeon SCGC AB-539-N05]
MDYKEWEPIYHKIVSDFSFSIETDRQAADVLNSLIQKKQGYPVDKLNFLIKNKNIAVFGAGPSLEFSLELYEEEFNNKTITIAADGATTALMKKHILPDIIVTDLDGKISDQIKANRDGSIVVIHAHGDNLQQIIMYVPQFKWPMVGTVQVNPDVYDNIYNFGGFTDGDRAVFLATHFQAKNITLVGFDFNGDIGKYSFTQKKNKEKKLRKLKWCKYLIELLDKQNIHYF